MIKTLGAVGALAATLLTAAPAMAACEFRKIGEIPVDMSHGVPTIALEANGVRKRVYVNTGADLSVLSEAGAAMLRATGGDLIADRTSTAAGEGSHHRTQLYNVVVGGAFAINVFEVLIGGKEPVENDIVGSLGQDILGASDVEFDFANNRMAFYSTKDCGKTPVITWEGGFSVAEIRRPTEVNPRFQTYVQLNGRKLLAQLGTNLPFSVVETSTAAVAGVKPGGAGVQAIGNVDFGAPHPVWVGQFQEFAIGDERIQNPKIAFSPIWDDAKMSATGSRLTSRVAGLPSMVLGLDFLKSHRVLLISSQGRMYFKFNGGTVFAAPGDQKVVPGLIGSAATSGAFGERETARR